MFSTYNIRVQILQNFRISLKNGGCVERHDSEVMHIGRKMSLTTKKKNA